MLKDLDCKNARPREKAYKLSDGHGLYLYVTPKGYLSWRWNYRFAGSEKTLTLGAYPGVKLIEARLTRAELDKLRRQGVDPAKARETVRNSDSANTTFEVIARQWHLKRKALLSETHAENIPRWLEKHIFPTLGSMQITQIKTPEILAALRPLEERSADRARRICQFIDSIYRYAIAAGLAENNPAANLRGALRKEPGGCRPALRKIEEAQALLRAAEATPAHPLTRLASRLLAITAVRTSPLRHAEAHEFNDLDGDKPVWRIPVAKMKLTVAQKRQAMDFEVPLPPQAVAVVKLAMQLSHGRYLFPNSRDADKPMSENALSYLYKRLPAFAGRHVPHGWRATFSTIMNERTSQHGRPNDRAVIELMLAHQLQGVEAAYNRSQHTERRREIANEWAELLLGNLPPVSTLLDGPRR